ncbi:MAG TPA: glutamine amidotransferase [Thermomicrobiales bacterium]|nr:glutamine amidotransferase [Thermomicrobiales bacterium]
MRDAERGTGARWELRIGWLYGHEMNIYGDRGNVMTLARRAGWRNVFASITTIGIGDPLDPAAHDIYFWGGGQDREQMAVSRDLLGAKGAALATAIRAGAPILAICGGYQLLGHYYRPFQGADLPGIGVIDVVSEAGSRRHIGNIVVDTEEFGTLVGFENHSGRTLLGDGAFPLGRVRVGGGNNGEDGTEGARFLNAIGCYMHGALLPKNPQLADWLIAQALKQRYGDDAPTLPALDDALERHAHDRVVERALALNR